MISLGLQNDLRLFISTLRRLLMATQFLRKIILEELQKVLKEEANMSDPDKIYRQSVADDGDSYKSGPGGKTSSLNPISLNPGQAELGKSYKTKSPYFPGAGDNKEVDLGNTTFTVKKKGFDKRVRDLQQDLNATGKYNLATDGILGPETIRAVRNEVGWKGTPQDMLANVIRIRGMLKGAIADYAAKKSGEYDIAEPKTKLAADLAAAGSGKETKDSITPAGSQDKSGPEFPPSGLPKDVLTPEQRRSLEKDPLPPLKTNESIAREIRKLLRSI